MKHVETIKVVGISLGDRMGPDGAPETVSLTCGSEAGGGMSLFLDVDAGSAPRLGELLRVTVEWGEGDE